MENKKLMWGVVVGFLVIVILVGLFFKIPSKDSGNNTEESQQVVNGEPIDVVLDFYEPWLSAVQSTSTDPYQSGFATAPVLSPALRAKLAEAQKTPESDPVLCQNPIPEKLASKTLYAHEDKAEVLVFSKADDMAGQAIVTLLHLNDGWYIDDILCSRGEFDVPREFTFDYEGRLLKSVPPPLDSAYWHLVYNQNGTPGYAAQLFFNEVSMCTDLNGTETVCDPNNFVQTEKVQLQGNMSEYGVEVKRVQFIE